MWILKAEAAWVPVVRLVICWREPPSYVLFMLPEIPAWSTSARVALPVREYELSRWYSASLASGLDKQLVVRGDFLLGVIHSRGRVDHVFREGGSRLRSGNVRGRVRRPHHEHRVKVEVP